MKKIFLLSLISMIVVSPLNNVSAEETMSSSSSNAFYVENLSDQNEIAENQALEASQKNKLEFKLGSIHVNDSNIKLDAVIVDKQISLAGTLKKHMLLLIKLL